MQKSIKAVRRLPVIRLSLGRHLSRYATTVVGLNQRGSGPSGWDDSRRPSLESVAGPVDMAGGAGPEDGVQSCFVYVVCIIAAGAIAVFVKAYGRPSPCPTAADRREDLVDHRIAHGGPAVLVARHRLSGQRGAPPLPGRPAIARSGPIASCRLRCSTGLDHRAGIVDERLASLSYRVSQHVDPVLTV